jgi:hypothetical protein
VCYEGNITSGWGSLSGQEETDRFFWGASLGVYVGHSETVLRAGIQDSDDQPLWWAKGGELIGRSPPRIRFFRGLWEGTCRALPPHTALTKSLARALLTGTPRLAAVAALQLYEPLQWLLCAAGR